VWAGNGPGTKLLKLLLVFYERYQTTKCGFTKGGAEATVFTPGEEAPSLLASRYSRLFGATAYSSARESLTIGNKVQRGIKVRSHMER
jgi:hypothetical protein